jgi:hypothetical protein
MTLLELYKQHCDATAFFLEKADNAKTFEVKDTFKELAAKNQITSGHIAHCIALFGDANLEDLEFEALYKKACNQPCILENPWSRGISKLQDIYRARCATP